MSSESSAAKEAPDNIDDNQTEAAASVKRSALILIAVIFMSIVWYLVSDRLAPYTTQARVQGYVVGVASKVSGLITKVLVKNNQEVQAEQAVFEIDRSQYEIALNKAKSDLVNAHSQVNAGDATVESARANLLAVQANHVKAEQDLNRLSRLYKQDPGTISKRRIEISQATLEQAKASVGAAKAEISRAIEQKGGNDKDNNAIIQSAQSAVAKASLDLDNTTVKAGARGVITDLNADVGQYVSAGQAAMTLVAMHDVWINAEYTENNLGNLKKGGIVEILFDVLPGQIFTGSIRSIGLGISAGNGASPGTLPSIENNRDWLRQSQRFPVIISINIKQHPELKNNLRVGGQASIIAYTEGHGIIQFFGQLYIRFMSFLSYAY